jgi:cell division protein FtsW
MRKSIDVKVALFFVMLSLVCIGLLMIYSSSAIKAEKEKGDSFFFLKKQLLWFLLGCVGFLLSSSTECKTLERFSDYIMASAILLLLLVFTPLGKEVSEARRWIVLGPLTFQPAEFAKIALILHLAKILSQRKQHLLYPLFLTFCVFLLIMKQPNMGTALIVVAVAVSMLFVAGAKGKHLLLFFLLFTPLLCLLLREPYRMRRIKGYLNPWEDPEGKGYHIIQSLVAIGSGGLKGVGFGQSKQKLFYLPENHTDFIFSILAEEAGFAGAAIVLLLFFFLLCLGTKVCMSAQNRFGQLVAFGVTSQLIIQAFLNIAVVTGLVPTCGIPLPFISYGGSSLLFSMVGIGLLCTVAARR